MKKKKRSDGKASQILDILANLTKAAARGAAGKKRPKGDESSTLSGIPSNDAGCTTPCGRKK